jgi:hypothetical protein
MPETILRQAKGFDRVYLDWEAEKDNVWSDVLDHLTYLEGRASVIPSETTS